MIVYFDDLVKAIREADQQLTASAKKAVNVRLTVRNWLIGHYIAEYELNGADRAVYGDHVLVDLAKLLSDISNCNRRQLYRYLCFYRAYPNMVGSDSPIAGIPNAAKGIVGTASPQLNSHLQNGVRDRKVGTAYPQFEQRLFEALSYSHFEKLTEIDDETKRRFYEVECLRGGWSVRELKRQIGSLYYERSGLSFDKKKLSEMANKGAEQINAKSFIRDPYVFEFLGLKPKEVMSESHLEDELMDKLEEFILELGNGFCFEARQRRILIGKEHYFIDLVFYHRILKCHVLIELKIADFSQENIGQLNTYVSWYRKNMMSEGDNPPVGILLCTGKDEALVEYALAGMDNNLFVSKYMLELPKKEELQAFIEQQMRELNSDKDEG
jgi:predicted nuclease of restriction endonuclease-like (RecB) superfamily